MKLKLVLAAGVVTAIAVAAVTSGANGASRVVDPTAGNPAKVACKGKKLKLGFSAPLPDPNYDLIYGMIARDVKKAGGASQFTQANLDPNKQIADIQSMVSGGINVLVVAPVNPQAVQPALNAARAKGVKIVATDVFVGGPYATNVATSPWESGYQAARYMKQTVGTGAVAAILAPTFAGEVIAARNRGFLAGAKQFGLNLVAQDTATAFSPDEGAKILGTYRVKFGSSLKGVWIFNDVLALAAPAIAGGGFNPAIVGDNGIPPFIEMIEGGQAVATWNLHPEAVAHTIAWASHRAVCGLKMPPWPSAPFKSFGGSRSCNPVLSINNIQPGDVGVIDPFGSNSSNHHFVVVSTGSSNGFVTSVQSIDGNTSTKYQSIQARSRAFTRTTIDDKGAFQVLTSAGQKPVTFASPRWDKVLA